MFTGIIEKLGEVREVQAKGNTMKLGIKGSAILEDIRIGDSIAVNGICLTVTNFNNHHFYVDVMPETFRSTSLKNIKQGDLVNLERAMHANGRFGGHFVTGHVDTVGTIIRKEQKENAIYVDITIPKEFTHLILLKGSIAIDGISLTVFGISDSIVTVSIIPHTAKETILGIKKVGDIVNIECDMLGKYVYSFSRKNEPKQPITQAFLQQNGFID